ncbi:probable protein, unknown function [Plasmodium sp. gorilla clade G3]|nr:probable protein, unknown function [Plasmodium sp. gorilla clade G3]
MSSLKVLPNEFLQSSKILKLLISLITKNYFGLSYLDDGMTCIYIFTLFAFGFIVKQGLELLEEEQIKKMEDRLEKIREDTKANNKNNNSNNSNNDNINDDDDDIYYDALDTFYSSHELLPALSASPPLKETKIKEINK